MLRMHNEAQLVFVDDDGTESIKLGTKGKHSHLDFVVQHLLRDVRCEGSLDCYLDHGTQPPKLFENREQIYGGEFVGGDCEFAGLQLAQLGESAGCFGSEVQQLLGI